MICGQGQWHIWFSSATSVYLRGQLSTVTIGIWVYKYNLTALNFSSVVCSLLSSTFMMPSRILHITNTMTVNTMMMMSKRLERHRLMVIMFLFCWWIELYRNPVLRDRQRCWEGEVGISFLRGSATATDTQARWGELFSWNISLWAGHSVTHEKGLQVSL